MLRLCWIHPWCYQRWKITVCLYLNLQAEKQFEVRLKDLQLSLDQSESHKQSIQNYVDFLKNSYKTMFDEGLQTSSFGSSYFLKWLRIYLSALFICFLCTVVFIIYLKMRMELISLLEEVKAYFWSIWAFFGHLLLHLADSLGLFGCERFWYLFLAHIPRDVT